MAVSTARMQRNVGRNLPSIGGGAVGIAAPATLREFADVQDGQEFTLLGDPGTTVGRLTRPSVAWGLGAGALTGVLYWMGAGPSALEDFYLAHTVTAIPTGLVSAALPREAPGGSGGGSTATPVAGRRTPSNETPSPSADGDFSPVDGEIPPSS